MSSCRHRRRSSPGRTFLSLRTATWPGATVVAAGLLGTAGCSSSSSASAGARSSAGASGSTLTVKQLVLATTLKHSYQRDGKGAAKTESLTQPDDIVTLGGNLYVGFQNGVGSQGEAGPRPGRAPAASRITMT